MSTERAATPAAPAGGLVLGLRLVGAALLAATAAIHLDLYLTGYNSIPTIGNLFLFQVIVALRLRRSVTGRELLHGPLVPIHLATPLLRETMYQSTLVGSAVYCEHRRC